MDEPTELVNVVMVDPDKVNTTKDGWLTPDLANAVHDTFEKLRSLREKGIELYWPLGYGPMLAVQIYNLPPLEKIPRGRPPSKSNVLGYVRCLEGSPDFKEWLDMQLVEIEEHEGGIDDRWSDDRERYRKNVLEKTPEQGMRLLNYFRIISNYNMDEMREKRKWDPRVTMTMPLEVVRGLEALARVNDRSLRDQMVSLIRQGMKSYADGKEQNHGDQG